MGIDYDAYLGLGIYNYLADVLPKFVKVLSFILGINGDKELGLKQIRLAHEKGVFTKTEALFFLGAIYFLPPNFPITKSIPNFSFSSRQSSHDFLGYQHGKSNYLPDKTHKLK